MTDTERFVIQQFREAVYRHSLCNGYKPADDEFVAANKRLEETAPPVLKLFQDKELDASPVFRLLRFAGYFPDRCPDGVDVQIALDNLELRLGAPANDVLSRIPLRTLDTKANRILKFLRKSLAKHTLTNISKKVKCDPKTARNRLEILIEYGDVVKLDDGRYTATMRT